MISYVMSMYCKEPDKDEIHSLHSNHLTIKLKQTALLVDYVKLPFNIHDIEVYYIYYFCIDLFEPHNIIVLFGIVLTFGGIAFSPLDYYYLL